MPTARSLILVSPDGERTMNTYLGACVHLGPEDLDADLIRGRRARRGVRGASLYPALPRFEL